MEKNVNNSPDLDNEAKITLGLLNVVHGNSETSQRSMAGDLGIALGLANAYLKRCVKKGGMPACCAAFLGLPCSLRASCNFIS